jgi:hypothetical protein
VSGLVSRHCAARRASWAGSATASDGQREALLQQVELVEFGGGGGGAQCDGGGDALVLEERALGVVSGGGLDGLGEEVVVDDGLALASCDEGADGGVEEGAVVGEEEEVELVAGQLVVLIELGGGVHGVDVEQPQSEVFVGAQRLLLVGHGAHDVDALEELLHGAHHHQLGRGAVLHDHVRAARHALHGVALAQPLLRGARGGGVAGLVGGAVV